MGAFLLFGNSLYSIFGGTKKNNVNKLSPVLNIVLLIAVGILYFLHFSAKPAVANAADNSKQKNDSLAKTINTTQAQKESKIVYLNIDTLFKKYEYYKKVNDEATAELKTKEYGYEKSMADFQQEYQEYMEKAQQGLVSKDMAEQTEAKLQNEKARLDNMQAAREDWQEQAANKLVPVQKKLYDFFKSFTKANGYSCILTYTVKGEGALGIDDALDVTNKGIKGLR